jgi:uncharacterized OB-fold protein
MEMWKCHTQNKQLPIPDEDSQIFWAGCRRQRLLIQRCDTCKTCRFPPSPLCPRCLSALATWQDDPGKGEVLTYCIYHSEIAGPAWGADLPYVVAVIHLGHSGVNMLSNLVCDDLDQVRIGLPVRVTFERVSENIALPKFVPHLATDSRSER